MEKIFNLMLQNKSVKITPSFRKYWNNCNGLWFSILSINSDNTVMLQDKNHSIFNNVPISEIIT